MKNLILLILLIVITSACEQVTEETSIGANPSQDQANDQNQDPNTDPDPEPDPDPDPVPETSLYKAMGVGGGGAMSGFAINPYSKLRLIGTDMGTLFRSVDDGLSWQPINHNEAVFNSHLPHAVSPGFSSDGNTVFHASRGLNPKRSKDKAQTFESINIPLGDERIIYWQNDSFNENRILCATTNSLYISNDKGDSWIKAPSVQGESVGTFMSHLQTDTHIYHGTKDGIWKSIDNGQTFSKVYTPSGFSLRSLTGGEDLSGTTIAFLDDDGASACSWAEPYRDAWGDQSIEDTYSNCGYVWIGDSQMNFSKNSQEAGNHLKMAENDSDTIYVTGGKEWIKQYGTQVRVTHDKGVNWTLRLNQYDWDTGGAYLPWPSNLLEYSAVALDIGWYDDGYESFEINKRDSNQVGGSGFFFLHTSYDAAATWKAPFTQYKDVGAKTAGKKWQTRGIEVISIYRMKTHPSNNNLIYAATADIGGMISEDKGESFRIAKVQYNSNYDYAFDSHDDQVVYAASGNSHDWPEGWHADPIKSAGGIYRSNDRGSNWTRLTPTGDMNRQFLSVGYDTINNFIYGGSHQTGIVRSTDNGSTWAYFNNGLPAGDKIIPQIEVDPSNGNVYALVTGNGNFSNQASTGIYFLDVANNANSWSLLRGTVNYPPQADPGYKVWYYPTSFAVDFKSGGQNLWLVDYENNRNWLMTGIWKSTDRGVSWDRVKQMTHPTTVIVDPTDSDKVYVAGQHTLDGSWGNGGHYRTEDGGVTWIKNETVTLQQNGRSVMLDPTDPSKIYLGFFGGGILYGPIDPEN